MDKDLDNALFSAWLKYLELGTAEDESLVTKPDRSNYREISCEVPILFTSDREKEWVNHLKQTILDCDFVLESCWME